MNTNNYRLTEVFKYLKILWLTFNELNLLFAIIVDKKVIVTREDGSSWILGFPTTRHTPALFTDVGSGNIEEMTVATPVCVGGRILVRTHDALWCIGKAI